MTGGGWGQFLARAGVLGVAVFVAIRAANAEQGRHTRHALTVAGTLTGVTGTPTLAFTLRKGTATCPATARHVELNGSTFTAEVPIDGCPAFFDGSDVTVDVSVNGTPVVNGGAVNPVPYARYADHYGTPDCPVGYTREEPDSATPPGRWFCRDRSRGDDVVRVGDGPSAFWIDRYEATVWTTRNGVETLGGTLPRGDRLFDDENDYPDARFPRSGQWREGTATTNLSPPAFALSVAGAGNIPARFISWFQAQEACRASGKRLPTGEEWLAAAQGTRDPGVNTGAGGQCVTMDGGPRNSGGGALCRSGWGAQDMVGNVWEWTSDWFGGLSGGLDGAWTFGQDIASNLTVGATPSNPGVRERLPAAAIRGGGWNSGVGAGVFALGLDNAPSIALATLGFRCVIPR